MRLKRQRFAKDCALACISMLLGKSYKDLSIPKKLYDDILRRGSFDTDIFHILEINGLKQNIDFRYCYTRPEEHGTIEILLWNRTAIIFVSSLNNNSGGHCILLHNNRIYDPSPRRTYKWMSSVYPKEVIIFKDMP